MSDLKWLQDWYSSMCDGDWEHQYGIEIDTIDNPGWHIRVSVRGTALEQLSRSLAREGDTDWFVCRLHEGSFEASGGSKNLNDILTVFRTWVAPVQEKEAEVKK